MKLFFGMLLALPVVGLAQSQPVFTIRGKVEGLEENSAVFVTDASNPTDTVALGSVKDGQFLLSGHVAEPNLYEVNFALAKKKIPVFMGNDKMTMNGSIADIAQIKTSGSATNDDFTAFQTMFTPYFTRLNAVMSQANGQGASAGVKDSLFRVYKRLTDSIFLSVDQFIAKRPNSYVSPFVLVVVNQLTEDVMAQQKRLQSLSADVQ